jgi:hypothetical protein
LGGLFQAGGTADLTLQYLFPEDAQFTRFGEVVYRDLDNSAVVGDYTGDGVVDAADYTAWRDTLGDSVSPGSGADGDNDGVIGSGDYQVWVGNFGATGASAGAGAVPEPVALSLVVCLLGAGLVGPRRTARATGVAA